MSTSQRQEKKIEYYAKNDFYSLERIFGLGSKNNYSITINNLNGIICWVAGPYAIFYDLNLDKQISFLKNINNKILSCVKFSKNGKLLATGESNCRNGGVSIYEFYYDNNTNKENHKLLFENKAHKSGIEKLIFMKDDRYILSIGNDEDKIINILDIKNRQNIFSSKFNRPILSSEVNDEFIILCGTGFIKKYNYTKLLYATNEDLETKNLMQKSLVDLAKLDKNSFVSTVIYENPLDKNIKKFFFITYDGYLVEMKASENKLSRWVHLKAEKGLSLTIWKNFIGCGLSDGIYRVFNADNLNHVLTLQRPPPLGSLNAQMMVNSIKNEDDVFPDVIASAYNNYFKKLVVIYSNKTFFVWDINQLNNIHLYRNNIFQSGGIKAMDYSISKEENLIKIATCSDDNTVIYWNIKLDEFISNPHSNKKNEHIYYSKYIRHIFYFCKNYNHFKVDTNNILHIKNKLKNNNIEEEFTLTSIRFSPDSKFLAIGDSIGNLFIYNLLTFEQIISIPTHSGDVNSIDTIMDYDKKESYLSTGGADSFITVFNTTHGFEENINNYNNILEKMKSPVLNVVFCIDKNKCLKLISAEQNSTITFFILKDFELQTLQQFYQEDLKTYCLNNANSIQKILSGHNGKISIWKTNSNIPQKHFQVNKGDKPLDNFRIASDSTGVIFATSNNDKIIRIRALHDGELLCKIPVSESITSIFFILNDNYLIATSIEGYIYFYKLNQELINKMQKNNDLINSIEGQKIINNKLQFLQKLMENDTSLSKNEDLNNLLEKFQKSEETTPDDLKKLNNYVKEGKKTHRDLHEENKIKKSKEIVIKEEKPNNNDDLENENNDEENKDNQNNVNILMSKSKIFEKELREKNILTRTSLVRRTSLTDTYNKKSAFQRPNFPKIKIIDAKKNNEDNKEKEYNNVINKIKINNFINKNQDNKKENKSNDELNYPLKENYDNDKTLKNEYKNEKNDIDDELENKNKNKNDVMEINEIIKNTNELINDVDLKFQNELTNKSNNNLINTENIRHCDNIEKEKDDIKNNKKIQNDELNLDDIKLENNEEKENENLKKYESNININKELEKNNIEADEYMSSIQSSFKEKIIDESESNISNYSRKYKNLIISPDSSGFNYIIPKKNNFEILIPCQEDKIILENSKEQIREISNENNIEIKGSLNNEKNNIEKYINNLDIDSFEGKDELKLFERKLEVLLNNIRIKLGYKSENVELENILEKYSMMLLNKIEEINKNK